MELLAELLPIIIYVLLVVLLVICIIIGYKVIATMNHLEKIIDDVEEKVHTFDKFFNLLNFTTDKITSISDTLIAKVSSGIGKLLSKRKKREEYDEDEDM